jgi:hypothetical protein
MFKFESFFKKGQEDVKKAAKIGTLAVGIGAGMISGAEKVQAQDTVRHNKIDIEAEVNKMGGEIKENKTNTETETNYDFRSYFNTSLGEDYGLNKIYEDKIINLKRDIGYIKSWMKDYANQGKLDKNDSIINAYLPKDLAKTEQELAETVIGGEEYNSIIKEYDQIFDKLLNHIASEDYLNKIVKEFDCSLEAGKKIQESRIDNLKLGKYSLHETANIFRWEEDDKTGEIFPNSAKAYLKYNDKDKEEVATHELAGHKATFGEYGMSKEAKGLFKEAVISEKDFLSTHSYQEQRYKYLSDLTEIYARKKVLDLEMEKLNIKKYGEPFIKDKHLPVLMKLRDEKKLSDSALEFLEVIKPEYFEKIFNEIAENNNGNYYHSGWNYNEDNNQENKA